MVDFIGLLAATMAGNRRVPSKALFTAKHLTVFGLFQIALSKRRGEKKIEFQPVRFFRRCNASRSGGALKGRFLWFSDGITNVQKLE